jgi:hypothetical protein
VANRAELDALFLTILTHKYTEKVPFLSIMPYHPFLTLLLQHGILKVLFEECITKSRDLVIMCQNLFYKFEWNEPKQFHAGIAPFFTLIHFFASEKFSSSSMLIVQQLVSLIMQLINVDTLIKYVAHIHTTRFIVTNKPQHHINIVMPYLIENIDALAVKYGAPFNIATFFEIGLFFAKSDSTIDFNYKIKSDNFELFIPYMDKYPINKARVLQYNSKNNICYLVYAIAPFLDINDIVTNLKPPHIMQIIRRMANERYIRQLCELYDQLPDHLKITTTHKQSQPIDVLVMCLLNKEYNKLYQTAKNLMYNNPWSIIQYCIEMGYLIVDDALASHFIGGTRISYIGTNAPTTICVQYLNCMISCVKHCPSYDWISGVQTLSLNEQLLTTTQFIDFLKEVLKINKNPLILFHMVSLPITPKMCYYLINEYLPKEQFEKFKAQKDVFGNTYDFYLGTNLV